MLIEQLHRDGRAVGTPGHERARVVLRDRMRDVGLVPRTGGSFEQPYRVHGQDFTNLIGQAPGTGCPYLFLSCGQWEHYHQPTDTPDKLSFRKMEQVSLFLPRLVADVYERDTPTSTDGYDTTATEIQYLRRAIGPQLDELGIPLQTRLDVDRLVELMTRQFGLLHRG